MSRLVRLVLMLALCLALPLQGLARAMAMPCMAAAHGELLAAADATPPCHGAAADEASTQNPHAQQPAFKACGGCCSACAGPVMLPAWQAGAAAPTVFHTPVPPVQPFVAGGPERPPRSALA